MTDTLQDLCDRGQRELMAMRYLEAERTLEQAEVLAIAGDDLDTLSRLYMPLQEARRQKRQRCGEGIVRLDLLAAGPDAAPDPLELADRYPQGQLLVAGLASIEPAVRLRALQRERGLYAETFLAAVYPFAGARVVVIVPSADVALPPLEKASSIDRLVRHAPPHAIVLAEADLPVGERRGDTATFAETMATWEKLHAPFLAMADATSDLLLKIEAYRRTIAVDYACELAHQQLSFAARELHRRRLAGESAANR